MPEGRRAALYVLLPLLAMALGGCSGGTSATSSPRPSPSPSALLSIGTGGTGLGSPVAKVEVRDGAFFYQGQGVSPAVNVKVGDIVEWDWRSDATEPHNVTFATPPALIDNVDPQASSPHQLNAGATWQVRFTRAGTRTYVCTFHSTSMIGTVVVAQ